MGDMTKIGIVTYHSAYNFGSVLKALATQGAINRLGSTYTVIFFLALLYRYIFFEKESKLKLQSKSST